MQEIYQRVAENFAAKINSVFESEASQSFYESRGTHHCSETKNRLSHL